METQGKTRTILTAKRLLWLVALAAFLGVIVLFVADNFVLIEVRLLRLGTEMRLAWALLLAFLLGAAAGLVGGWLWGRANRR